MVLAKLIRMLRERAFAILRKPKDYIGLSRGF
jgi:hypothetical protein